jgi:hypothetical protein
VGLTGLTNADRGDGTLRYEVLKDGVVVDTVSSLSYFWNRSSLTTSMPMLFPAIPIGTRSGPPIRTKRRPEPVGANHRSGPGSGSQVVGERLG